LGIRNSEIARLLNWLLRVMVPVALCFDRYSALNRAMKRESSSLYPFLIEGQKTPLTIPLVL